MKQTDYHIIAPIVIEHLKPYRSEDHGNFSEEEFERAVKESLGVDENFSCITRYRDN